MLRTSRVVTPHDTEVDAYVFIKNTLRELGWNVRNPERIASGQVWTQNECLSNTAIKTQLGRERPENIVKVTDNILWVIEAKRSRRQIEQALSEAEGYAKAINQSTTYKAKFISGVAGNETDGYLIRSKFIIGNTYKPIRFNEVETTGLLSLSECRLILDSGSSDVADPPIDDKLFLSVANHINEILQLGAVNPHQRASVMAALLLSMLSDTGPNIEERSPSILIRDINARAENVLKQQGKSAFYEYIKISLPSTTDNHIKFRKALVDTIQELNNLNIRSAMNSGADWLGAFYEVFLKYANWAQDLGIVLTPRHATRFVADVMDIQATDIVFDPTCGTGGFLVAAFDSVKRRANKRQVQRFKENGLFGVEQDAGVASLAVVNMIFRGDGKNNIIEGDCFQKFLESVTHDGVTTAKYVTAQSPDPPVSKVMMNPPFALKIGKEKEFKFVNQALAQVQDGGILFSVLPYSTMVRSSIYLDWRKNQLLTNHTLLAVMTLPPDLFYPIGVNTVGVFIKKGTPHPRGQNVLWLRAHNDGLLKSKGRRLPNVKAKNDFEAVRDNLRAFLRNPDHAIRNVHEFAKAAPVDWSDSLLELAPEAYLTSRPPSVSEVELGTDALVRETIGFLIKNKMETTVKKRNSSSGRMKPVQFAGTKVSDIFSIDSGEVHNASDLDAGDLPLISCGDLENGFMGRFTPPDDNGIHTNAFTIAYNGQPFTTKFHPYAFLAKDDVAVAYPKDGIGVETAFLAAVMLNSERWRYSYGRKCFKAKLKMATIPMPKKDGRVDQEWSRALVEASPYWYALKGHI